MNAKTELMKALTKANKTVADITKLKVVYREYEMVQVPDVTIEGLDNLDFVYKQSYGIQQLFGLVLFNDNTWLERSEYDGSEWWSYKSPPTLADFDNI
jgi:hypothetical protein